MKTKLISSALALALASSLAVAEENGIFVGVGLGYNSSHVKIEGAADSAGSSFSDKYKYDGLNYEIIAGYKQFFTPKLGARYYVNFAYANTKGDMGENSDKLKVMDYGVNADALYNFISNYSLDLGAFLGLGVGADTYKLDNGLKKTGFNVALNVGLRSVIHKHHGIEIAARVPFMNTTLEDVDSSKTTARQNYSIGARYIFNF